MPSKTKPLAGIEPRPVAQLIPYARNSRTHSDDQIAMIAASIEEFGMVGAIVVRDGVIAKGHGTLSAINRLYAAGKGVYPAPGKASGAPPFPAGTAPVLDVSGWTDAQFRAYVIADNQLAVRAGWDIDLLRVEIGDLGEAGFDIGILGFEDDFLAALNAQPGGEGKDPESTPPVPEIAVSAVGDIWELGRHRLVIGDSTSITDVERLMGKDRADMVFTDPPYNVDYEGKAGKIKNDKMGGAAFDDFLDAVFGCYVAAMKSGAAIYVCHPDREALAFHRSFAKAFELSCVVVWVKDGFTLGRGDYHSAHEPIMYGWPEGAAHSWHGDRKQTTIWTFDRDKKAEYVHPTQKPVDLVSRAITNSSKGGDIVLDLFGGSGSTLIACERDGRTCRTMELDPRFGDVIIQRWQEFAGGVAVHENGKTFEELTKERKNG